MSEPISSSRNQTRLIWLSTLYLNIYLYIYIYIISRYISIYLNIYLYIRKEVMLCMPVSLFVCLYPINVQTAGPNCLWGLTLPRVGLWMIKILKISLQLKIHDIFLWNPWTFFLFLFHNVYKVKMLIIKFEAARSESLVYKCTHIYIFIYILYYQVSFNSSQQTLECSCGCCNKTQIHRI